MNDPDRLLEVSESEVERLLLRAGREDAPEGAAGRALAAATAAVAASTLAAGSAAGATAAGPAAVGAKAASLVSLKWIAIVGLASLGAVAGTVAVRAVPERSSVAQGVRAGEAGPISSHRAVKTIAALAPPAPEALQSNLAASAPAPAAEPTSTPLPAPTALAPSASVAAPPPMGAPGAAPRAATPGVAASAPSGSTAAVELATLDRARSAIASGDAPRALSILEDYASRFPRGAMGPEASVLRIEALVAAGDQSAAERAARSFLQAHPQSPYAQRIETLLRGPNP